MREIEKYGKEVGLLPTTVLQRAAKLGGKAWGKWQSGGSCSMRTADRIRKYMSENPPKTNSSSDSEAA